MTQTIGIDIGGTHFRIALVSQDGKISLLKKIVIGQERSQAAVVDQIIKEVRKIQTHKTVSVGIGAPGIVDSDQGLVFSSPHFPEWHDFNLASKVRSKLSLPVMIDNDANMIALGELWQGAAKDWPTFMMITLGTGIGGALVIDSKIFHGNRGFAGEFGHMVVAHDGPECACGSRGCFETFVSATALLRYIQETMVDGELPGVSDLENLLEKEKPQVILKLVDLAKKENWAAKEIFSQMGYYLGLGLASLINVTGIQKIVIGGGLIGSHQLFLDAARKELANRTYQKTMEEVEIRVAYLGDEAGVLGAARLALEKWRSVSS